MKQRALFGALFFCLGLAACRKRPAPPAPVPAAKASAFPAPALSPTVNAAAPAPPSPGIVQTLPSVTVLCYHTFDSKKVTPFTVSSANFETQLNYLRSRHIAVIPLPDLIHYLHGGATVPDHAVVITIDDGYRSARTRAWPLLKKYDMPFTLFIYPEAIGRHPNALTWSDIRYLAAHGADIESHSMTHPLLTHPGYVMAPGEYTTWLKNELTSSKQKLEAEVGKPVRALAYPYGGYDEKVIQFAKDAGYAGALTCNAGAVIKGADPMRINRSLVFRTTSLAAFTDMVKLQPLVVEDLSPRDGQRLRLSGIKAVQGRVANWEDLSPIAYLRVDKAANRIQEIHINQHDGSFEWPIPAALKHGYYFVSLRARDRRDPTVNHMATWQFIAKGVS